MRHRLIRLRRWWKRHGLRLHRRRYCAVHGRRVWWTTGATRARKSRSVFCSPECKDLKANPPKGYRGPKDSLPKCPRPDKLAFDTEAECAQRFKDLMASDLGLKPYLCRCGKWHCGHDSMMKDPALQIAALLSPETAEALMAMISESEEQEQQ